VRAALKNPEIVHRRRWITLVVLCVSLLVILVDNSILNVALPTLAKVKAQGGIGASESSLQWIVDSYTLVFAGLLLTAGSLGDKFGRYGALTFGLVVFGTFSALAAFSSNPSQLIAYRALMGIGGAFIMPSTLSILTNVFTDPKERGRAIGVWAGISAVGIGIGPISGGFLLQHFWWGSVLLVNLPIVIIGLILGFVFIPSSKDPESPKLDPLGAGLSIFGLGSVLWSVIEGPTRGWTSTGVITGFVVGVVLLAIFMWWETTSTHPMLNIRFFKSPRFSGASGAITLTFMALFGVIFLLTQYLQSVLGYSPLEAGALLLPQSVVMMVLAPMSARIVERAGTKVVVGCGLLVVVGSLALMTQFQPDSSLWLIILATVVLGAGMANVMAPATESIMGSLPRAKAGVGSAVNDTTRQVGGAIGVALLGSLLSSRYLSHLHAALSGSPLPANALHAAQTNIQAAVEVSKQAPAPFGAQLAAVSKDAFMSGLHLAVLVAAGIVLVATAAVFVWLPARAPSEAEVEAFAEEVSVPEVVGAAGQVPALADDVR
jgi:EmrB/QacA subfamily drug resistance transporter